MHHPSTGRRAGAEARLASAPEHRTLKVQDGRSKGGAAAYGAEAAARAAAARWNKLVAADSPAGFVVADLTGKLRKTAPSAIMRGRESAAAGNQEPRMHDEEDQWFGVFQKYRPHGDGVEELFAGLPNSAEFVARLRSVYQAAYHEGWAQDAYFIVRNPPPATDEELIAFGRELAAGLKMLGRFEKLGAGDPRLFDMAAAVQRVEVVPTAALDLRNNENFLIHALMNQYMADFVDDGRRVVRMKEGFYSVACDFWLANYLKWPHYEDCMPSDVFRPYFELWSRGCRTAFQDGCVYIARGGP